MTSADESPGRMPAPPPHADRWTPELARYHGDAELGTRRFGAVVTLRYGGHALRYVSESRELALEVSGPRLAFVVPDETPPSAEIRCRVGEVQCSGGPTLFRAGEAWSARRLPDGREEICFGLDNASLTSPWCRIEHDAALASVDFTLAPSFGGDALSVGFPTDEYVMARRLARGGGLLLHASSLVQDGVAYLFVGHSGAGKSTTAMNAVSAGAEVLSDDRTIVTLDADGGATAHGTPWHGSYRRATNASAPLAGIFVLVQDSEDSVVPVGAVRAVGELFVRLVHPTSSAGEVEATLDTLERLVGAVPVAELRQRPTPAGYALAREFASGARR